MNGFLTKPTQIQTRLCNTVMQQLHSYLQQLSQLSIAEKMFVSQTMSPFDIIMHSTKWRLHAALFMLFILNVKQSGIEGLLKASS